MWFYFFLQQILVWFLKRSLQVSLCLYNLFYFFYHRHTSQDYFMKLDVKAYELIFLLLEIIFLNIFSIVYTSELQYNCYFWANL